MPKLLTLSLRTSPATFWRNSFLSLHPWPHSFGHYPDLVAIGEDEKCWLTSKLTPSLLCSTVSSPQQIQLTTFICVIFSMYSSETHVYSLMVLGVSWVIFLFLICKQVTLALMCSSRGTICQQLEYFIADFSQCIDLLTDSPAMTGFPGCLLFIQQF